MSLTDRKLASEEIHSFRTLLSVCRCIHAADRPMERIIEFLGRISLVTKEFLLNWREKSFRIYNAVKKKKENWAK